MAFLRRGTEKVPHKKSDGIIFRRCDSTPIRIAIKDIQCWEEHQFTNGMKITVVYWGLNSSTAVIDTFDAIDAEINGKAVAS